LTTFPARRALKSAPIGWSKTYSTVTLLSMQLRIAA